MFGVVVRLIRALRAAAPVDASPAANSCGSVVEALRAAVAGIGATLDEETTCAELTRAAADCFGCGTS